MAENSKWHYLVHCPAVVVNESNSSIADFDHHIPVISGSSGRISDIQ